QCIRTGDCFESVGTLTQPHPRDNVPVIEPDDQFHLHRDFSAQAFDDADDVRVLASRRHEIDQAHCAIFRFQFCFQDECFATITTPHRCYLFVRKEPPVPIFFFPEQRRKTCRRIEPGKAKPIHTPVATHQRAGLRVTKKSVVLYLCSCLRHSDSFSSSESSSTQSCSVRCLSA